MELVANYLWLQRDATRPSRIPSPLFYRLQQNVERYHSSTAFNLWVDHPTAAEPYHLPQGLTVRQIADLPYLPPLAKCEWGTTMGASFWVDADRKRLQTIQQSLSDHPDARFALYADMDSPDIAAESEALHARLNAHGLAFGATFRTEEDGTIRIVDRTENGYMAVAQTHLPVLESLMDFISHKHIRDKHTIFWGIQDFMDKYALCTGLGNRWPDVLGCLPVLPPCNDKTFLPHEQAQLR